MSHHLRYGRPTFVWAILTLMWIVRPLAAETVLHNFAPPQGFYPVAGVIRDKAGNLYGTTTGGGNPSGCGGYGCGVVYKMNAAGHETVLYTFTGGADGGIPRAGVIRDKAGNLYGTTSIGGNPACGVVYKVDATGHETVLHKFAGTDGCNPWAGVIRDAEGNLYGTTTQGGNPYGCGGYGCGVVYKIDATGHETVLHTFTGRVDGGDPVAGVIRDAEGNLYGTTTMGGNFSGCNNGGYGCGVVYKVDATGHETVLYSFAGGFDAAVPYAGVIRDPAGNLYGTTTGGGLSGDGAVYKLDPTGSETVLYSFTCCYDGSNPYAGVIRDSAGNLYGTTYGGGRVGAGVVYKVDATGHETVLYNFQDKTDGGTPWAGVIRDSAGSLYGTTEFGGSAALGVVYKLDAAGQETVLYNFTDRDGIQPQAGVIRDKAGNLYGTTYAGGIYNCHGGLNQGCGVVYKVDATGHETVLHEFAGTDGDGGNPYAGVIRDAVGNLYGTTIAGENGRGFGDVYKVDASGHFTVLYSFADGSNGEAPYGGVIRDKEGNLYGTTTFGGSAGWGVVYKLDPSGNETVLYSFTGGADGGYPYAGVIRDKEGNLYGTTYGGGILNCYGVLGAPGCGVVYKLDPSGHETILYSFTGGADGGLPYSGLMRDSVGNLYGTTTGGGTVACYSLGCGVVYKVDTSGHETVLYSFTGGADGGLPYSGLIRDSAGNLYGTTTGGGIVGCNRLGCGVVYKVDASGHETVLYSFTGGADGGQSYAGVILDQAGNLYGTTAYGGTQASGVVFRIP